MTEVNQREPHRVPDMLNGAVAGIVGGIVAAFLLERFQAAIKDLAPTQSDEESAPVKAADQVSRVVAGRPLPDGWKQPGGEAVHYALGAALGTAYGVAAEYDPRVTAGLGTLFGLSASVVLDETLVPVLGLSDPPWRSSARAHAFGLISHLVFGLVTETTRRQLRASGPPLR